LFNPSEPYTPYDVEITPVTRLVGQGEITRQTAFTWEGGKFTSNKCINLMINYIQFKLLVDHVIFFVLKAIFNFNFWNSCGNSRAYTSKGPI